MNLFVGTDQPKLDGLIGEYFVDMLTGIPSLRVINHRKVFFKNHGEIVGYNVIFKNWRWGYFFVEELNFSGLRSILINYNTNKNSFFTRIIRDCIRYDSKRGEYIGKFNILLFGKLIFLGYFSLIKNKD